MSRRARHRGARLPALFGFDQGAPTTEVDEIPDNPRARPCPVCGAAPGHGCTTRARRRTQLADYHPARKTLTQQGES